MSENLKLWNAVSKTDPKHTKKVEFGRKFTAIDAHYQIMRATEVFGPAGVGWGWDYDIQIVDGLVMAHVKLWHGETKQYVKQTGAAVLVAKSRVDHDAPKKAITDGLTKCLSYLGFSADVFLGKFDDNKYVTAISQEFQRENANAERENAAHTFAVSLEKELRQLNDFEDKVNYLGNELTKIKKLTEYKKPQQMVLETIRRYCFSQFKHMLSEAKSKEGLLQTLNKWNHFRNQINAIDPGLRDELAHLEDEEASRF